jgi:peptidyl-Lys metalloendopeptidase
MGQEESPSRRPRRLPESARPSHDLHWRLHWRIEARPRYAYGGAVEVSFFLENHGPEPLRVLAWGSPLEGLFADFLRVELEGRRLPYRGPMVKRGEPSGEEYLLVEGRGELSNRLDLSRAYRFDLPGEVRLKVDASVADCLPADTAFPGETPVPRPRDQHRPCPVHPAAARFRIEED